LTLWWAAFLISNWASQIAFRAALSGDTPEELQTASAVYAVSDGVDFVAALLAIWVVRTITAKQIAAARSAKPSDEPALGTSSQLGEAPS
jgi:hypothetical protein